VGVFRRATTHCAARGHVSSQNRIWRIMSSERIVVHHTIHARPHALSSISVHTASGPCGGQPGSRLTRRERNALLASQ